MTTLRKITTNPYMLKFQLALADEKAIREDLQSDFKVTCKSIERVNKGKFSLYPKQLPYYFVLKFDKAEEHVITHIAEKLNVKCSAVAMHPVSKLSTEESYIRVDATLETILAALRHRRQQQNSAVLKRFG